MWRKTWYISNQSPHSSKIFVSFYVLFVLCCSEYCLFCVILCIVCVEMCTILLPPSGNWIAVNKCIISYEKHDSKDPDTDGSLNQWFCIVTGQGMHVSDPKLKSKSRDFTKKLCHLVFKATHGWLSWWISRYEIKFKKAHGENNTADVVSAEVLNLLQKFCKDDIYKQISRPVLSCYARQYPELQIHQTVWFKECSGSHNCVVFSKPLRNW
jgi:hypothetical protein